MAWDTQIHNASHTSVLARKAQLKLDDPKFHVNTVNANFNLNIFQKLKLSTDNLSGMTDQVILNLSLAQLARLGEAKEFKSNMLKKQ